jgi:hypothetical protein
MICIRQYTKISPWTRHHTTTSLAGESGEAGSATLESRLTLNRHGRIGVKEPSKGASVVYLSDFETEK